MQRPRRQFITPLLTGAAMVLTATGAVHADLGDQLAKLLPDDGAVGDSFSFFVGISGDIAIVGAAPDDNDNGEDSGSVYLFDMSDPKKPVQIAKLLANDGSPEDWFGCSGAISGDIAIVGAWWDDDNGVDSGSAYLFNISDPANPRQLFKLLPDDGAEEDWFGIQVAVNGSTAIVTALFDDDNGDNSGSAYLFDTTSGKQISKLLANDGAAEDSFGIRVAISGDTAIVGAYLDDDKGDRSGSAYLFDIGDPKNPVQIAKLLPSDGAANDVFGLAVGISGDIAIVGAPGDDDNGDRSGSAYLFDISDPANPTQLFRLVSDDGAEDDCFGVSVGISGATAIVGAHGNDDNGNQSGSAYLFDASTGDQMSKLLPDDGALFDTFGLSAAISSTAAIVGAHRHDDNGEDSGAAYIFDAGVIAAKCPWDLDDDNLVGASDLIVLLGAWGDPYGAGDLIELLGNWGPCPR